jgi:hypothetical protein
MEYGHSSSHYSEQTAATIDEEIRRLIGEAHTRAVQLLKENRAILDNMSRVLVEKETIYTEEVKMLMKGADYKEVIAYMEEREGEHAANPFLSVTNPSKEHLVEETPVEQVQETAETDENNENNE